MNTPINKFSNPDFNLKKGNLILIDFDGIIVEDAYPGIGKVKEGIREFLENCFKRGIYVYIWSARCNNNTKHHLDILTPKGATSVEMIRHFMTKEGLYFTDILFMAKPLSYDFATYFLDDRATNDYRQFNFKD